MESALEHPAPGNILVVRSSQGRQGVLLELPKMKVDQLTQDPAARVTFHDDGGHDGERKVQRVAGFARSSKQPRWVASRPELPRAAQFRSGAGATPGLSCIVASQLATLKDRRRTTQPLLYFLKDAKPMPRADRGLANREQRNVVCSPGARSRVEAPCPLRHACKQKTSESLRKTEYIKAVLAIG